MNIFSEIYGAYFRAAERLLGLEKFGKAEIFDIVSREAFADSFLFIEPKLVPDSDGYSDWGLIKREKDGTFSPVTKNIPPKIVTSLQKRWLKSKLFDRRFKLFFNDETLSALEERLKDVRPLYDPDDFCYYDVYSDGDDYGDPKYREHFRKILSAVKNREILRIDFVSGRNEPMYGTYLPVKLEYSRKNDKFRVYCRRMREEYAAGLTTLNIGRIRKVKETGLRFDEITKEGESEMFSRFCRCGEPAEIEVTSERNGVERFMMEFAGFEKRTELDINTGKCRVLLYYDRNDETELLIRLLSYGPVLKVIGPESFRSQMEERVKRQFMLLFGEKKEEAAAVSES